MTNEIFWIALGSVVSVIAVLGSFIGFVWSRIDKKFDKIDVRFDKVWEELRDIKKETTEIKEKVSDLAIRVTVTETRFDDALYMNRFNQSAYSPPLRKKPGPKPRQLAKKE